MKLSELVAIAGDDPLFDTGLLLVGAVNPGEVRRQLSRWTKSGRVYQLRRGLYAIAPPYQRSRPHPFVVANRMVPGSYVSCQSALAFHGLIPEHVPVTTSVTTRRPARYDTPLGAFEFRHLKRDLLQGYRLVTVYRDQQAFVAAPEKALLDLIHLEARADSVEYLQELRLQNLDHLDISGLRQYADRAGSPKLRRAAGLVAKLAEAEGVEFEQL